MTDIVGVPISKTKLTEDYLRNMEESLDRVIDEITALNRRQMTDVVFSALKYSGNAAYPFRVYMLVSRLLLLERDYWNRTFKKATTKRGRALPQHRKSIRAALNGAEFQKPKPQRKTVHTISKLNEVDTNIQSIILKDLDTSIKDSTGLINALGTDAIKTANTLVLDFSSVDHVYVFGLSILAASIKKRSQSYVIKNASRDTSIYLERIGFDQAIAGEDTSPYRDQQGWAVKLTPVTCSSEAETVSGQLVEVFDHHLHLSEEQNQALYVVMSETVENVLRHGKITSPAFVCAQVYSAKKKLSIAIVDAGIGFRQSFLQGDNPYAIHRILDQGDESIDIAVEALQTSKIENHAGYGLYVVKELAGLNGGHIRISSEDTSITYVRRKRRLKRTIKMHKSWNGSIICLLFDLRNPLDLNRIYSNLPSPRGYISEDFF